MSTPRPSDRFPAFWAAWSVTLLLIVTFEAIRWANPETRTENLTGWLCGPNADWLPFLPIFLAGLMFWKGGGASRQPSAISYQPEHPVGQTILSASSSASQPSTLNPQRFSTHLLNAIISLLLGALATGIAAWTGWKMQDLPPAYHDEYSYLFQALTFLDGRTSYPSFESMPQLFDQMHVLNEGRFASRYFPGAGAWFAAFHDFGSIWGLWIAQGIVAVAASVVAGEIAGRTARIIAGLAVVFSPGLVLFSQLYLAHLPTLVGLSLFLVAIIRLRSQCVEGRIGRHALIAAFFAGLGLAFAMLCRPMTAAGVGLPFGVWLFDWLLRKRVADFSEIGGAAQPKPSGTEPVGASDGRVSAHGAIVSGPLDPAERSGSRAEDGQMCPSYGGETLRSRLLVILFMGVPILAGMGIQLVYNLSITGQALLSPYQLYTDIYTPRHGYGFNNVVRGEQHLGPKVLDHYDRWAENLTLPLAVQKMGIRVVASGRWTLGLVTLAFVVVLLVWNWKRWSGDLRLIVASIASLHLVHLPYWFEGIMGWHYVFESAPLWAIVLGVVTTDFARQCRETGHGALRWWWGGVLLTSLATAWFTVSPLWPGRLPVGLTEVRFSRNKYADLANHLQEQIKGRAIVFIRPDPSDRHIDYVYNTPRLDAPILRARAPQTEAELQQAIALFPDRTPWLFDVVSGELRQLDRVQ